MQSIVLRSFLLGVLMFNVAFVKSATFVVNRSIDAVDSNPGDGICQTPGSVGSCTLRAAVMEANENPGVDIIIIVVDEVNLTIGNPANSNGSAESGDLDIKDTVLITSDQPASQAFLFPIIDATMIDDRVFDISGQDGGGITISNIKLVGGDVESEPVSNFGGAIRVRNSDATVVLRNVLFINNHAFDGGALGINNSLSVVVKNSVFSFNQSLNNGAAIFVQDSNLDVESSSFNRNVATTGSFQETVYLVKENDVNVQARFANVSLFGSDVVNNQTGINARGTDVTLHHVTLSFFGERGIRMEGNNGFIPEFDIINSMVVDNEQDCGVGEQIQLNILSSYFTDENCEIPSNAFIESSGLDSFVVQDLISQQYVRSGSIDNSAIDSADNIACLEFDQLGTPRPLDGNLIVDESECDRGAIESDRDRIFYNSFENSEVIGPAP